MRPRSRPILAIDADGVLADWTPFIAEVLGIKDDDARSLHCAWAHGRIPDELKEQLRRMFEDPHRIANVPPMTGAVEAVRRLAKGHDLVIVTSLVGSSRMVAARWQWARMTFGSDTIRDIVWVPRPAEKPEAVSVLIGRVRAAIDDLPMVVDGYAGAGVADLPILFDFVGCHTDPPPGAQIARSWDDVLALIHMGENAG